MFLAKKGEPFDWKGFQEHMGFTDEELEDFKSNPKKAGSVQRIFDPELATKCLVIEVVESRACGCGLKPGDRLYFLGCGLLDTKRSSNWCSHALAHISLFADTLHNLFIQGLDLNEMYYDHFTCPDAGLKLGHGIVTFKAYVEQMDISNLPPL